MNRSSDPSHNSTALYPKCPACGKPLSESSFDCPFCASETAAGHPAGRPAEQAPRRPPGPFRVYFASFLLGWLLFALVGIVLVIHRQMSAGEPDAVLGDRLFGAGCCIAPLVGVLFAIVVGQYGYPRIRDSFLGRERAALEKQRRLADQKEDRRRAATKLKEEERRAAIRQEQEKRRESERLAAQARESLNEEVRYGLVRLLDINAVKASFHGESITRLCGEVRNLLPMRLKTLIPAGTAFRADGKHQHMVCRLAYGFSVDALAVQEISFDVCCLNLERDIPGSGDSFDAVYQADDDVKKFLAAATSYGPMVAQAGVWAIVGGFDRRTIQSRLTLVQRRRGERTAAIGRAISSEDIASARELLAGLGIRSLL